MHHTSSISIYIPRLFIPKGSYICDIILLYVMKKRSVYTESKLERMTMYVTEECLLEMLENVYFDLRINIIQVMYYILFHVTTY